VIHHSVRPINLRLGTRNIGAVGCDRFTATGGLQHVRRHHHDCSRSRSRRSRLGRSATPICLATTRIHLGFKVRAFLTFHGGISPEVDEKSVQVKARPNK
jgi:hypothetical protein